MPAAWTCLRHPKEHGSFNQRLLSSLGALGGAMPKHRFGCPICVSTGRPGWVRPASAEEAAMVRLEQED